MNSSNTIIHDTVESSQLTLVNVQAENDELEIICAAVNSVGIAESEISITTIGVYMHNVLVCILIHTYINTLYAYK